MLIVAMRSSGGRLHPQRRAHAVVDERVGDHARQQPARVDQLGADRQANRLRVLPAHAHELRDPVDRAWASAATALRSIIASRDARATAAPCAVLPGAAESSCTATQANEPDAVTRSARRTRPASAQATASRVGHHSLAAFVRGEPVDGLRREASATCSRSSPAGARQLATLGEFELLHAADVQLGLAAFEQDDGREPGRGPRRPPSRELYRAVIGPSTNT